ncbi:hypothetical protein ACSQ34_14865 (plasmid) [Enterococcus mundtii]|uniref:hypothetical protein n=1 Tax=Enterococcus mundtii TaxID=53346 RepID=UPI00403CF13E
MGIDFINVEFRKHVKVSGDLGTTGSVCPFSQKQKMETLPENFLPPLVLLQSFKSTIK